MVGADYCIAQRPASSPEGGKRRPNQRATSRPTAVRPDSDLAASYLDAWSHMRITNCCRIAAFGMAFAAELQNVVASRPNSGKLPCLQTRRGTWAPEWSIRLCGCWIYLARTFSDDQFQWSAGSRCRSSK